MSKIADAVLTSLLFFGHRYLLSPSSTSAAVKCCNAFARLLALLISRLKSKNGSMVDEV